MTVDNVGKSDSPGATHAPHHAPKDWIAKFKGKFDHGWDKQREITFENQKKMGLIPPHSVLTARPNDLPAWDNSTAEDKKLYARMMEVRSMPFCPLMLRMRLADTTVDCIDRCTLPSWLILITRSGV